MADLNTRDLERIVNHLKRRNYPAARAAAEAACAAGPAVHETSHCPTRIGDLVCSLPVGHDDTTGFDHFDARHHRFFRYLPEIPRRSTK